MEREMTDDACRAAMSAPIELELTHSAPLLDADPVTTGWPMPGAIRCEQINLTPSMRELLTCKEGVSIPGVFDVRSLAERIVEKTRRLLFGERSV
jgi:hypothetical protein